MSKQWIPCELHTHTVHSDAKHTLEEMAVNARKLGIDCLALTDHNTTSGHLEREAVTQKTGLKIIKGLEWTTFHGHMLTLGISDYVDWRKLGPKDLHKGIKQVHEQEGVVGIAHPFRVGSPMCTGCYWEYEIEDWNDINYIEVWSGLFPSIKKTNQRAFDWWTDILNKGYKVSATSGRDWHDSNEDDVPLSITYLGIDEKHRKQDPAAFEKAIVEAIRTGSISVTVGPLLNFEARLPEINKVYEIGETLPIGKRPNQKVMTTISVDFHARNLHWELAEQDFNLRLVSNDGVLQEELVSQKNPNVSLTIPSKNLTWLRAELFGVIKGIRTLIAFTNPIYLD